ncbi:MAG TPA: acyl-CoA thioesterase [Bacteroidales bacterium]|jgi:acyl-CoA thioester hydrolase|nr:acyl-CoA thioesterase [Bacteroidales bacterium]
MKHSYKTEVRGYELDSYGHVNNAVYISYTEQARWEILKNAGLLKSFLDKNLLLVVTETNIRYMRELKLFDEIEIITKIKFEAPYLVFIHDVLNLTDNIKAAKAEVKTLLIDKDRIPQDIPAELLSIVK